MTATIHRTGQGNGERGLGWSLGMLLRAYESLVRDVVAEVPHGHRGYRVLAEVVDGGRPSQLALAAHLGIDRTVMTYVIDDLVAADLAKRQPDPADRRRRRVVPTPSGRRALRRLTRRVRAAEDELLGSLDPQQRESLCALLHRVADDVHGIDGDRDLCEVASDWLGDAGETDGSADSIGSRLIAGARPVRTAGTAPARRG